MSPHLCEAPISASQFKHFITDPSTAEEGTFTLLDRFSATSWILQGVNTRGAGEGKPLTQGEKGEGEFSGPGGLLSISLSGESNSLSPTLMSFLILCAKGGRFEGEETLGEPGKGRFFAL